LLCLCRCKQIPHVYGVACRNVAGGYEEGRVFSQEHIRLQLCYLLLLLLLHRKRPIRVPKVIYSCRLLVLLLLNLQCCKGTIHVIELLRLLLLLHCTKRPVHVI
jgi:hypothetical protein